MNQSTESPPVAAIYCRVSTARQEDEGTSLASQEAACRAYAAEQGFTVAAVYRETHSGAELFERPRLSELRESVRRGEVAVVIAFALDRLTRNQAHLGLILSEATHAGASLELVSEKITDTPEGRLVLSVNGYVAEMERLKFRERSARGRRSRAEAGKPIPGWKAPYGYRWADEDKTRLILEDGEALVVRRIFHAAASGTGIRRIAIGLADDGIPSPSGLPHWPHSTIHDMLRLPTYTGDPRAFRTRVEKVRGGGSTYTPRPVAEQIALKADVAPAIVDHATQEAVLARLARNKAEAPRRNADPEATLLRSGFARCGYCGLALQAVRHRQGWLYRCQGRDRGGSCPSFGIQAAILDRAVWERVETILTDPDVIRAEVERQRGTDPTTDDLAAVVGRLATMEGRRRKLARAVADLDDAESSEPLLAELSSLAAQKRALEAERVNLTAVQAGWEADQCRLADLAAWCSLVVNNLPTLSYAAKRDALVALGVQARVWRVDAPKRWEITMAIDGFVSDSGCSVGHKAPLVLRWSDAVAAD